MSDRAVAVEDLQAPAEDQVGGLSRPRRGDRSGRPGTGRPGRPGTGTGRSAGWFDSAAGGCAGAGGVGGEGRLPAPRRRAQRSKASWSIEGGGQVATDDSSSNGGSSGGTARSRMDGRTPGLVRTAGIGRSD
ncbi:hypothetical protein GCM10027605_13030 [Micromonospora zhanjiangensis]